ncbi:DUF6053 domain-containing protein [Lysobacter sp. CA199]
MRSGRCMKSIVGGPSGPTASAAAIWPKSVGPEGPPTKDLVAPS